MMDIEDADDPMEIDEPVPIAPIIERLSKSIESDKAENSNNTGPPKVLTTATPSKQVESSSSIVILDDDDEDLIIAPANTSTSIEPAKETATAASINTAKDVIIDLVEKPKSNRCINTNCIGSSEKFTYAPDFCLSYFRVKKSSGDNEEICEDCYYKAIEDNDKLATSLIEGNLLFKVDFPIINETLQIDDSDEEDEKPDNREYISDENFKFISENIEEILMETIEKFDIKNHIEKEKHFLTEEAKKVEADCEELTAKVNEIRTTLDKIQIDLYNQFRPEIKSLKGMIILDDYSMSPGIQVYPELKSYLETSRKSARIQQKPVSYTDDSKADEAGQNTTNVEVPMPKDLPKNMLVDKPAPQPEEIYYIKREGNPQASWIKARLNLIITPNTPYKNQVWKTTHYKLTELKQQKERILSGKDIAYTAACKSRLGVGTRVISVFKSEHNSPNVKKTRNDPFYAGVVGEHPVESNKYRYLIFFDIGYAQYVPHFGIHLVLDSSQNVWEDMPEDSRPFIKKYLESQDRPMVKMTPNQTVRVEYNGKWWPCSIKAIDCSLVHVFFDALNRWEWIYRGSTRLSPMFREEQAAVNRHTGMRPQRKAGIGINESASVVQYTRNNDFVQPPAESKEEEAPKSVARAVARKSTTRPNTSNQPAPIHPFLPPINNTPANITGPTSKIMYFTPRDQQVIKREYRQHECGPQCKIYLTHNFVKLKGHNPLSKPLLCGWARMTLKDRGRKVIIYKAPCGRMIRDISEIHYYLRITESEMTVDLFDFNHMVRCLAEFSVECAPDPKDLSKGLEQVPIPVINGMNNDMLDFCNYSIKRVPMEGVHMNLDSDFLCGCDCDDDCVDKLKCSCWKLTLEGLKYLGKDVDPISVGYIYRRLQEQVITGIYECNSKCKCTQTCLNRVAQNPLSLKLQVFKTPNKGWGIRCLNDIPQGSFICIYAGTLLTEHMANEDGMQYGDEYFAELDYIETVEKYKEDYEEDVVEDEDFEKEKASNAAEEKELKIQKANQARKRNTYMEDNDFTPSISVQKATGADDGIRSRLRRRKDDEEKKEDPVKVKQELHERDIKSVVDSVAKDIDTVTISDEEDEDREVLSFNPKANTDIDDRTSGYGSVREIFGPDEKDNIYIMDAKNAGNIGRFLNHSCSPNVFVQNVFVDTHDVRFPWVAFFSSQFIRAGTELTWNYNYDIGSVPGRILYCNCASLECKGRLL